MPKQTYNVDGRTWLLPGADIDTTTVNVEDIGRICAFRAGDYCPCGGDFTHCRARIA